MKQRIELYTAQEQEFIETTLNSLGIAWTATKGNGVISSMVYEFNANPTQLKAIGYMMASNYESNYK